MASQLDTLDLIVLTVIVVGAAAYFTKGTLWGATDDPYSCSPDVSAARDSAPKSFLPLMNSPESDKNCIVFYGSQTGTAEDFAARLAREGATRFGLRSMAADLESYDFEDLSLVSPDRVLFFVLATYGEGEPTDNAADFYNFIMSDQPTFSVPDSGDFDEEKPLKNLKYVAFGLGNTTYELYNKMVRDVCARLDHFGARRISDAGEGDDGTGTMEEDFLSWKEGMWKSLAEDMSLEERDMSTVFEPVFNITERLQQTATTGRSVYLGEPNRSHLDGKFGAHISPQNPFIATVTESHELFTGGSRNCIHVEIDLSGANAKYITGDHIAVWPSNSSTEVDLFLKTFGLDKKRDMVINVEAYDPTTKIPFPVPTTYDAAVRYYLEICHPVSRQFLANLAMFAPKDNGGDESEVRTKLTELGKDSALFEKEVTSRNFNLAQFLSYIAPGKVWDNVPFSLLIEGVTRIQPRYYSISSSSMVSPDVVSITAAVESVTSENSPVVVKGVATNYLFALTNTVNGAEKANPLGYDLDGPRGRYSGNKLLVHLRHSAFRIPTNPAQPIIMVGPGTGVAPFRGFMQERCEQFKELQKAGKESTMGKSILFYGCRRRGEDYLYSDEWKKIKEIMGDKFEMHVAFSRENKEKVYVQNMMRDNADEINRLLTQKPGACFYVCGDASRMAREVNAALGEIISSRAESASKPLPNGTAELNRVSSGPKSSGFGGIDPSRGHDVVKWMRQNNLYLEDVWS